MDCTADILGDATRTMQAPRLGEILVARGEISSEQLTQALARKQLTGRRIGEELVAAGHLSRERLAPALSLQRRIAMAAVLAALLPSRVLVGDVEAAQARAQMTVSANVVDTVSVRAVHQAQDLVVTPTDVARGYVEAPAASQLEIGSKGPWLLEFRPVGNLFKRVKVSGFDGAGEFGPAGGAMLVKPAVGTQSMNYRFDLAPGTAPGAYRWPLALTLLPM
jgi:hypothetical protein